jgi:hypothetical protein
MIIFAACLPFYGRHARRAGRVVDCGSLENCCPGNWTGGSNPSLSATSHDVPAVKRAGTFVFTKAPNEFTHEGMS